MKPLFLISLVASILGTFRLTADESIPAAPPRAKPASPAGSAIAAYRDGRPNTAAELARPLAAKGDADACFLMGFLLDSTREPPRLSRGQAMIHYYRQAEAAGHPEASARRLLVIMASGSNSERKTVVATLESDAASGDTRATRVLGEAWLRGFVDGKPNPIKALEIWTTAAKAGDAASLVLLGKLHSGDIRTSLKQDQAAAIECYRRAAELSEEDAYLPLGKLLLAADNTEGLVWLEKAVASHITGARLLLGDHALEVGKDREAARDHYSKGAQAGNTACMHRLAGLLLADPAAGREGLGWLRKAADAGDPRAAADLGHRLSDPTSPDYSTARRYLTLAALEMNPAAQYELALLYLEGKGAPADPVAAVAWLTEAMKAGDAAVQFKLATLHEDGIGTPVNYANAGVLYTLASNKGHAAAPARIARMAVEGRGTEASIARAWVSVVRSAFGRSLDVADRQCRISDTYGSGDGIDQDGPGREATVYQGTAPGPAGGV